MIDILKVRSEVSDAYRVDITAKSRVEIVTIARYNFRNICLELGFSLHDVASALNMAEISIYNRGFVNYEPKGRDKIIRDRIVRKFQDDEYFTELDGYKIKGKPLNSLMFELSTWSEELLIEFMESSVKQFKREKYINEHTE